MSLNYEHSASYSAKLNYIDDDIVISGIAGRFPNSGNVAEFSQNLYNKIDMIDELETRWKHTNPEIPKRFGKIHNIEKFDASFFSVHHRQANCMDPQGRMLLEHAYEAILDAGINPKSLRGSSTGVFVGCCFVEIEEEFIFKRAMRDGLGLTGTTRSFLANRISFALDLHGPSFTVDTACSSSMFALDAAYNAIKSGACSAAIVGGSNLIVHPNMFLQLTRMGIIAENGVSRPFDQGSTGYTRAEAVSVIFLQKKSDAVRSYADLVYSKTNNDGFKKEGIVFPSGESQYRLMKGFYEDLKMDPSIVNYVEAHSTGTVVGDPQECQGLDEIFCKNRTLPLKVGSVKSNMGHSEAVSGLCSIAKVILALEKKLIAPNLHYNEPRGNVHSLVQGRLEVVTEPRELDGPYVSINSFGFGGGNSHTLYKGNLKEKRNFGIPSDSLPRLVSWCGRTEEAVTTILDSVSKRQLDAEYIAMLQNIQISSNSFNTYRGYGIFTQSGVVDNAKCLGQHIQHFDGVKRPIVWIYSGMGSQWSEMGADLMKIPIFANAIENCHNVLETKGLDLKKIITSADPRIFDNILHSFVGIAAIQIGLTDVLKALDIVPDYIVGHSVGELGCAYADGCVTAEEMILSSYSRGLTSVETKVVFGSMAAVGLGYDKLKSMVPDGVIIACHNSSESCTVSGPVGLISNFVAKLKKEKYLAKEVPCSNIPYHSPYISAMGPSLFEKLSSVLKTSVKRSSKWISSSVPESKANTTEAQFSSARYHTNNLLGPVLFEEACNQLPKNALTIEIAPHGLLQAILKGSLPKAQNIALTKRGNKENSLMLIDALGKLFVNGVDMNLQKLYPKVEFPVSRGTPMISPLIKWDHSEDRQVIRYEGNLSSERTFQVNISETDDNFISGNLINGKVTFPAAGFLYLAWCAFADSARIVIDECDVEFEDVNFLRSLTLTENCEFNLDVVIQKETGKFQVNEGKNAAVTGIVRSASTNFSSFNEASQINCPVLSTSDFYKELRLRGYRCNGLFRSVVSARADGQGGSVRWDCNWISFMTSLLQIPIVGTDTRCLMLPSALRKVVIKPKEHKAFIDSISGDEKVLKVKSSQDLDLIQCCGVEMRGLKVSYVERQRPKEVPIIETDDFIPHLPTTPMTKINMARFCVQLTFENLPTHTMTIVEVDAYDDSEPLCKYFEKALGDIPLVTGEISYLSSKSVELGIVMVQDLSVSNFQNLTFIIKSQCLSDTKFLETASNFLKDGGFVVAREKTSFEDLKPNLLPDGYQLIAAIQLDDELVVLLQYFKVAPTTTTKIIQITSQVNKWLDTLKEAVASGPIIAYSYNDEPSGIIGLVKCIRKEPNKLNLRCVLIDDPQAVPFDVTHPFYKTQLDKGLAINVLRNAQWGSFKHSLLMREAVVEPCSHHAYADCLLRGDLSSISWLDGPSYNQDKLLYDDKIVNIQYSALNYRDVLLATGKWSSECIGSRRLDQLSQMGLEYSGITKGNERVMGLSISGTLATHVLPDESLTWKVPDHWSLEDAATIPVTYGTVYSALFLSAKVMKGKTLLVHSGSGLVGLAAIRVALAYGLNVFTTVTSEENKEFLLNGFPELKGENIGSSQDTSFEEMIKSRTKGNGVDYVLNSLSGDKLQASVRCLGKGGKFIELGRLGLSVDIKVGLETLMKEITFSAVQVENIFTASVQDKKTLSSLIKNDLSRGVIIPLSRHVFEATDVDDAFRFLANGKNKGKILVKIRQNELDEKSLPISVTPKVYCRPDFSYILCGGLGGFGLELADWLVLRGCRKLVLSSRRGITSQYQAYRIRIWKSYGVEVEVNTSNIAVKSGCEKLIEDAIKLGPVGGIFNLAMVLIDNIFENLDVGKFVETMGPKAVATKHLDEISRVLCPNLQYFVAFSSVSCGKGNGGQSSYGFANSVMERIIEQRHALGLPAKAIQWGAIDEVGFAADLDEVICGTLKQRISSCLEIFDLLMTEKKPIVSSFIVSEKLHGCRGKVSITDTIMNIMSIRDVKSLSMESTLAELGMDSLMTVEMIHSFEREHDFVISALDIRTKTLSQIINQATS